jgi:two-component system chemotaxis response regulator CheB
MMDDPLRVLVVDDSALVRRMLKMMLESDPHITVVGEAANGRQALLRVAELRPQVITMDVRMPVMDGLETTEQLMAYHPTPILVVTASLSSYDIDITFEMLDAGALDIMEKPRANDERQYHSCRLELIRRVKMLSRMRVVTHLRGRRRSDQESQSKRADLLVKPAAPVATSATTALAPSAPPGIPPVYKPGSRPGTAPDKQTLVARHAPVKVPFPLVVIGASAGGPRVVHQILMGMPGSFTAAVVVVQHIADGFGSGMAEWLAGTCALPVHLAQQDMPLAAGEVYIAPDGYDLQIRRTGRLHLHKDLAPRQMPCPSVDVTMQTAADVFGNGTMGVLLTGMWRDGALGMQRIRLAGGYTLAQDEASAPIYGMPRAAVELGAVDEILPPEEMVAALQRQITRIRSQMPADS